MELSNPSIQDLLIKNLKKNFGFPEFRGIQLEALTSLMTKGRLLCILPTGYGKSLLYQLPASLLEGITLVISPLLALMRDQLEHLNQRFKIPAAAINSDQTEEENHLARMMATQGRIKILFVAPEQLDHIDRFNFLLNLNVSLVVVDEAHCISTWGHDFRPSYRQILNMLQAFQLKNKNIKMLGLTATANKRVENDIKKQLFLAEDEPVVIRQALHRPNIHLSVLKTKGIPAKLAACEELLKRFEGCGLIYCATRENTECVADYLKEQGYNVTSYHAGYAVEAKRQLQKEFISDQYKALAATNALGMGIDKGNLRFIIHFDSPGSITAYYQEVGRCGRDGKEAQGVILYDSADKNIHDYFIESALPTREDFMNVLTAVGNASEPPSLNTIKSMTGLHPTKTTIIIAELIEQEFLEKYSISGKQYYKVIQKENSPDLSRYSNQELVKKHELKQMLNYGEQEQTCRMVMLRRALGDEQAENCQRCDCCLHKIMDINSSPSKLFSIHQWLDKRPPMIAPVIREKISAGLSILDSKLRSPLFIHFMKHRAVEPVEGLGMQEELITLIKMQLENLRKKHKFTGIIPLPSQTWKARENVALFLAQQLQVPLLDVLLWKEKPSKRQGELLNNNQRHDNVHQHMYVKAQSWIPNGVLLLLDDYIGSGNTLKEAGRAIRAHGISNELVPFTIVAVKWSLGKQGFV